MPSDISRTPDNRSEPNTGIVAQQGRVIVDHDLNTLQTIVNRRAEAEARDVIGPAGTPDDGFAISLPTGSPPSQGSPPFWEPPLPLTLGSEPDKDFLINPGTMYVGGQRVVFPSRQAGKLITYAYFDQPDWSAPPPPTLSTDLPNEAVYLEIIEQALSAVEDPNLLDVALGGVDTTGRLRQLRRVVRSPIASTDCTEAWTELTARWLSAGLSFDPQTMRLEPTAKLLVSFDESQAAPDPCDPAVTGGYLGAENQLIRVQISASGLAGSPTTQPQLLWGYDNASFLYRVSGIAANGTMLQVARDPPDAFHTPQNGQVVEILRTASIITSAPDETDPTGQRTIVRCVAEQTGFVTTLTQAYGAAISGNTTNFLVLAAALPTDYLNDTNPLFVRIWQGLQSFTVGQAVDLVDPVKNAATGFAVTISAPAAEALAPGAYWQIAVRPSTPQLVYPERLLSKPQPPDGPREWICPLAVIDWSQPLVHDCRQIFDNLVTLTKRPAGGCCTVNLTPSDLTVNTLQTLIDRAVLLAEQVTVCLGPGIYELPQPLRLNAAHNRLALSSCAGGATVQATAGADPSLFTDGLLVVTNASGVVIRGLQITLPTGALPQNLLAALQNQISQSATNGQPRDANNTAAMIGVRAVAADTLTIEDCGFEFPQPGGSPDVVGAAVFLQGDCSGLTIRRCSFTSAMPPTFTPPTATAATPNTATGANVGTAAAAAAAAGNPPSTSAATTAAAANLLLADTPSQLSMIAAKLPIGVIVKAAAPPPLIATVGVLAISWFPEFQVAGNLNAQASVNNTSLACRLGNATFHSNIFSDLIVPALMVFVDGKTVRLQDNDATGCVAGLWLLLNGAISPSGSFGEEFSTLTGDLSFLEVQLAILIGRFYPFPAGATVTSVSDDQRDLPHHHQQRVRGDPGRSSRQYRCLYLGEPDDHRKPGHDSVRGAVGQQATIQFISNCWTGGDCYANSPAGDARR